MFKTSLGSTVDFKLAALQGLGKRLCEVSPTIQAWQLVPSFFRSCLATMLLRFYGWSWIRGCAYRQENSSITRVLMSLQSSTPINVKVTGYETISILCEHNFHLWEALVSLTAQNASTPTTFLSTDKWKILNLTSHDRTQLKPRCTKYFASNCLQVTWMVCMWNGNKCRVRNTCLDLGPTLKVSHAYVTAYAHTVKSKRYQNLNCFWSQAFLSMG